MVIFALVAAQAAIDPPSGPWRLECQLSEAVIQVRSGVAASVSDRPVTPIRIVMDVRGDTIASVRIDGPPEFSSPQGLHGFVAAREFERTGAAQASGRAQGQQWRGRFGRRAIRLNRNDSEILLSLDRDEPGTFTGYWSLKEDSEQYFLTAGYGEISCRTPAPQPHGSTGE